MFFSLFCVYLQATVVPVYRIMKKKYMEKIYIVYLLFFFDYGETGQKSLYCRITFIEDCKYRGMKGC